MTHTKKYFGTDGIRGCFGDTTINPQFMVKLGWAVGKVLADDQTKRVIIGKDTRISGYVLESALESGLLAAGVDIELLGPMPTPAIAYLVCTLRASAGIVISASHNPFHDNGVKFFSSSGQKLSDAAEQAIEAYLDKPLDTVDSTRLGKASRVVDAPGRYIEFCKSTISNSVQLHGLKLVVDCANGATYHIAPQVFRELGAQVIELATQPDGFNINASCGSTHITRLQRKVRETQADLGIAFDGDGDRLIMVDHRGDEVDGDELLYIIAYDLQQHNQLQGGVVGTQMSNLGLEEELHRLQIPFCRTQVGDRYVLNELLQLGWQLGGESSGHIICLDKTTTGDGLIAALQVLRVMHHKQVALCDLRLPVKFPQVMVNVPVQESEQLLTHSKIKQVVDEVQAQLPQPGRVLLRPSGTEPLIRVMVEAQEEAVASQAAYQIADVIRTMA